jgi:hypothetical protein
VFITGLSFKVTSALCFFMFKLTFAIFIARMYGATEDIAPSSFVTRRNWLMDELECLEQTLNSRRAELRELEQLLVDHKAKLEAVQAEVSNKRVSFTVEQFQ